MAYYGRARNIPELQEVQIADRREWWRTARARVWQGRVQRMYLSTYLFAFVCANGIADWLHLNLLAGFLVVLAAAGMVAWPFEVFCLQPRARQWLREHLHEFHADDGAMPVEVPRP